MLIRVAQWATGTVGTECLRGILDRPELELVAVHVSTPGKEGRDAGDLAGRTERVHVRASRDRQVLVDAAPHVVVHAADADSRIEDAVADLEWLLRSGFDVVSSGPVMLQYPWGTAPDEWVRRLEAACLEGHSSLHVTGIDPGFANDTLPLTLTSLSSSISEVRCFEISDFSTYDDPAMVRGFFGFGTPMDTPPPIASPGVLSAGWGPAIRQLAAALHVDLDPDLTEHVERVEASEDLATVCCDIAKGTQAGLRFVLSGTSGGRARVVIDHVYRARTDVAPDWPAPLDGGPASFRVHISGEPDISVELTHRSSGGDHSASGMSMTAMRMVNAVEAVHTAVPGIVDARDLPLISGRGLVRTT